MVIWNATSAILSVINVGVILCSSDPIQADTSVINIVNFCIISCISLRTDSTSHLSEYCGFGGFPLNAPWIICSIMGGVDQSCSFLILDGNLIKLSDNNSMFKVLQPSL